MNATWTKIVICAVIGAVLGTAVLLIGQAGEMELPMRLLAAFILLPLAVNLVYWGWVMTAGFLGKLGIFLVMTPVKWLVFFLILFFVSYFVGLVAFPMAIYRAVKNEEA